MRLAITRKKLITSPNSSRTDATRRRTTHAESHSWSRRRFVPSRLWAYVSGGAGTEAGAAARTGAARRGGNAEEEFDGTPLTIAGPAMAASGGSAPTAAPAIAAIGASPGVAATMTYFNSKPP